MLGIPMAILTVSAGREWTGSGPTYISSKIAIERLCWPIIYALIFSTTAGNYNSKWNTKDRFEKLFMAIIVTRRVFARTL